MDIGLDIAADTEVTVDEGIVVALEGMTGAGEGGFALKVLDCDTGTGALDSPAAKLWASLKDVEVCVLRLLPESNLAGGGWVKATEVGGLCLTGGVLAGAVGGAATGLGLIAEETV